MIKHNKECTNDRFLNDVKDHTMSIVKDDGAHRFIRFKRPNTNSYWFDITTWPGFLCISGDMGTYVFSRLYDMFEFFRMDDGDFNKKRNALLNINPNYWSEKLQAISKQGGYAEFDPEEFTNRVKDHFENYMATDVSDDLKSVLWNEIEEHVLFYSEVEYEAYNAIHQFSFTSDGGEKFTFVDFFDSGSTEVYTYHYIWCLYAIVWGISQYDLARREVAA